MEDNEALGRIPSLSRDNYESWFREMKLKLKSRSVFFTIETTLEEYATTKQNRSKTIPSTSGINGGSIKVEVLSTSLDETKVEKYEKAEATSLFLILQALSAEDFDLIDEHETALRVWNALKGKYFRTNEYSANTYLTKIATFEFRQEMGLDNSWAKLKEFRRKLISADPIMKNAYPDAALFLILTKTLPAAFKATTDGFRIQVTLSVEDKLKILNEVEEDLRLQNEKALVARQKLSKFPQKMRQNQNSDSDSPAYRCYLCKRSHTVARCPRLETAARLLKEHDRKKKVQESTKPRLQDKDKPKTSRSAQKQSRYHNAFSAETLASENEDCEECHLSKEEI